MNFKHQKQTGCTFTACKQQICNAGGKNITQSLPLSRKLSLEWLACLILLWTCLQTRQSVSWLRVPKNFKIKTRST